ncbi:hypothetical protein OF83DRAFT_1089291 [Amylostereum chailletii]|nr:hypothetical protein OF83DRAFT_1089291 [Amylostereum chailletii]
MPSQDTTPVATLSLQGVHPQSHQVQKPKKKTKADLEKELQELCDARAVAEQATAKLVAENASLKAKIAEAASIQDVSATNAITIPRHHAIRGSHKPAVTKAIILHDLQMLGVPASSSKRLYRTVQVH